MWDMTGNKTIVFVEDNPTVLMAYRNCLEQEGFRIETAGDGLQAVKILSGLVPELVILDLVLPRFNGADVLKFIQSNPRLNAVPIIILSTNSILDAAEEHILQRAHRRLLKDSCTPAIIVQAVQELLATPFVAGDASAAVAHPPAPGQTTDGRTIVFVEDNPVVSMAYRNRLAAGGFHVEPARDGLEAMKILGTQVPDVVVLDLMLPKFSGLEVLKFISSNPHLNRVCVIILSNNCAVDAGEEYILERANKRLLKGSCTPAILLQTIQELLGAPPAPGNASPASPAAEPNSQQPGITIRFGN
jgi:two-component system sensor histidine kinase/response regulator